MWSLHGPPALDANASFGAVNGDVIYPPFPPPRFKPPRSETVAHAHSFTRRRYAHRLLQRRGCYTNSPVRQPVIYFSNSLTAVPHTRESNLQPLCSERSCLPCFSRLSAVPSHVYALCKNQRIS